MSEEPAADIVKPGSRRRFLKIFLALIVAGTISAARVTAGLAFARVQALDTELNSAKEQIDVLKGEVALQEILSDTSALRGDLAQLERQLGDLDRRTSGLEASTAVQDLERRVSRLETASLFQDDTVYYYEIEGPVFCSFGDPVYWDTSGLTC